MLKKMPTLVTPAPMDHEEDLQDYINEDMVNVGPPDISDYQPTPQIAENPKSKSPERVLLKCKIHSVEPLDGYK